MVAGAIQRDARIAEALQGIGEGAAVWIADGSVEQARCSGRGRGAASALPGVESQVMVIATSGQECGLGSIALSELKPKDPLIKGKGAVNVGNFQVDMANVDPWVDRLLVHALGYVALDSHGCSRGYDRSKRGYLFCPWDAGGPTGTT